MGRGDRQLEGVALRLEDGPRDLTSSVSSGQRGEEQRAHILEKERDLGRNMDKLLVPEVVLRVPEQLDERDECAPRVRAVDEESFQQHPSHDLSELIGLDLMEEVQHQGAEPMGVRVGVTQVEDHCAKQVVLT